MLRRVGIVAALVSSALLLSGCGGDKEPAAVAVTQAMPVPSPSWTPPPAGMWTESDLAEGREVPPEEMDRLRPLPEVPEEPETITHNTEQGAKDAVVYFARLASASIAHADVELLGPLMNDSCSNCSDVYEALKTFSNSSQRFRCKPGNISIKESEVGPGDILFYVMRVGYQKNECVELDSKTGVIQNNQVDDSGDRWFAVQYIDGEWRPLLISLTEKPDYE